jgi:hypothetical protein
VVDEVASEAEEEVVNAREVTAEEEEATGAQDRTGTRGVETRDGKHRRPVENTFSLHRTNHMDLRGHTIRIAPSCIEIRVGNRLTVRCCIA